MASVKKKAQAAIEYLINYTWLLAVVAMVGGSLFLLYGEQDLNQEISGFDNDQVQIKGATISENRATFQALTRNNAEIKEIILQDGDDEISIPLGNSVSESNLIEVCGITESDSEDIDVTFIYDSGDLENLATSGTLQDSELSECLIDVSVTLLNQNQNQQTSEYSISIGEDLYIYSVEGPTGLVGRINIIDNPEEFADKKHLDIEVQGNAQPREYHNYAMVSIEEEGVRQDIYEDFLIFESGSLNVTVNGEETIIDLKDHQTNRLNIDGTTSLEPFSCTIILTGCVE